MLQLLANTGLGGSSPVFLDLTSPSTPLSHSVLPASALSTLTLLEVGAELEAKLTFQNDLLSVARGEG